MYSKANRQKRLAFFMKRIAIISDTHSLLAEDVVEHLQTVDEIWHAGDLGNIQLFDSLSEIKPLRAVYGNIDSHELRVVCPLNQIFDCEGLKVLITHIGGYPGRYNKRVSGLIYNEKPDIYICGHSHICKVMKDHKNDLVHINPGACGIVGFHVMRTMVIMECENAKVTKLQVVELGRRAEYNA